MSWIKWNQNLSPYFAILLVYRNRKKKKGRPLFVLRESLHYTKYLSIEFIKRRKNRQEPIQLVRKLDQESCAQ